MFEIDLSGTWLLTDGKLALDAEVPCSNYTALLKANLISDPFYSTNEANVGWVAEKDWSFSRDFSVSADMLSKSCIMLNAEMLDTLADIFINGKLVMSTCNAHLPVNVDIKEFLQPDVNSILIAFKSPLNYIKKKQKQHPAPNASMGVDGVPHIRKPQCHFGWDWGPILPVSGIFRSIKITAFDKARIDGFEILQTHNEDGSVTVIATANNAVFSECDAVLKITCPDGTNTQLKQRAAAENKFEVKIKKPELWFPRDVVLKETQPLYCVELEVGDDTKTKRIGLRTIKLNRDADEYGNNFCFECNGVPVFAKGANWIPADSFIDRFDSQKLKTFIDAAKFSNFNMIRVWGGGYYESDDFYDACDEAGIMVWQDLGFACAPYPFFDEEFLASVKAEIAANVKRLKHHPSLALWCGNNEIEMMTIGWRLYTEYVKQEKIFFYDILPDLMASLDAATPFINGSPVSSKGFLKSVNADSDGDTHLWHVWHGLQPLTYYRKRKTRFCSEFGLESLPSMKTVESFASPKDYSLKSKVFKAHQKCDSGNDKMIYYISTRFRLPKSFEDTVYLSQIIQSECVSDATLHWRRNRGVCNGSLYWQFNDCWPVTSWSSIDYYGRYKALQYRARSFMRPLSLSLENNGANVKFFVLNDTVFDKNLTLNYILYDLNGTMQACGKQELDASALSADCIFERNFKREFKQHKGNIALVACLYENGELIDEKTVLFDAEKNLKLKKASFDVAVKCQDNRAYITLNTDCFARFVRLELPFDTVFSDNYFDMVKGVAKTVTCDCNGLSEKEIADLLKISTVADIKAKGNAFTNFFTRARISLIPINVANRIYYHTV